MIIPLNIEFAWMTFFLFLSWVVLLMPYWKLSDRYDISNTHKFSRFHKLRSTKGCCVQIIQLLDKVKGSNVTYYSECNPKIIAINYIVSEWNHVSTNYNHMAWQYSYVHIYSKKGVSLWLLNKSDTHKNFIVAKSFNIPWYYTNHQQLVAD